MQFRQISTTSGQTSQPGASVGGPRWGSLPLPERALLVDHLRQATRTPSHCWFCVWDGYGDVDVGGVTARLEVPGRRYLLAQGDVSLALGSPSTLGPRLSDRSANLWWPDDRAWIVATEIDFAWTYVGGAAELVDRLLRDDRLEAMPARIQDRPFADSDDINTS